jgi:hypothetical protein
MTSHLLAFSQRLAAIMPEIGSKRLPPLLVTMLKGLVPFDNAVIVHFQEGHQPRIHYNDILGALAFIGIDKRLGFVLIGGYATVKRLHEYVY